MGLSSSSILKWLPSTEAAQPSFPKTLEEFGYAFNLDGQLRDKATNEPFQFDVNEDDHHYNQMHYNAFSDAVTEKIYEMLMKDYKLQKSYLPIDAAKDEPQTFVFISGDLYTNSDKLMLLIHGNGAVRAGQWSKRLIINECLDSGTQFPYIKWARENGYAVIVANPSLNTDESFSDKNKRKPVPIRGSSSPEEHCNSVWHEFVQRSAARHVAIVAHSYGGVCTLDLIKKHIQEFECRVFAIALTDSVHGGLRQQAAEPDIDVIKYFKNHAKNWASAYDPLDTVLQTTHNEVPTVSAGTDKHENTSFSCMKSVFKFLIERYENQKQFPTGQNELIADKPQTETANQKDANVHNQSSGTVNHAFNDEPLIKFDSDL